MDKLHVLALTSIIAVRLTCGLKKTAIVLCESTNRIALINRIPCIGPISLGSRFILINAFVFFHNENATSRSSAKRNQSNYLFKLNIYINSIDSYSVR